MNLVPYSLIGLARLLGWRGRIDYHTYLRSPAWAAKRARVLRRAGYRCEQCGSHRMLQVHHKTYKRLGHEWMRDLVALCADCHKWVHGR